LKHFFYQLFLQQQKPQHITHTHYYYFTEELAVYYTHTCYLHNIEYFNNMENKLFFSILVGFVVMVTGDNNHQNFHPIVSQNYIQPSSLTPSSNYNPGNAVYSSSEPLSYPPSTSYVDATSNEEESQSNTFDLSLIVIPILIIAGVSLLFPSITTVTTRKRRNAAGKNTHTHSLRNHLYIHKIYIVQKNAKRAFFYSEVIE